MGSSRARARITKAVIVDAAQPTIEYIREGVGYEDSLRHSVAARGI